MVNNSDYTRPRTNLFELLPEVYQSRVNRSLFENTFNRFLTKQETLRFSGYIGEGNKNAVISRQLPELSIHRQGYQQQPLMYAKIGSVEWISSWYDILNKAERFGVDRDLMQQWLDLLKFNWIPPIDLDKFVNYRDYYWYDEDSFGSAQQYITIRSRCATATAQVNFQQSLIDEFGATIPTIRAEEVDETIPSFDVNTIDHLNNEIIVSGNALDELAVSQYFNLAVPSANFGVYKVDSPLTFNPGTNETTIPVEVGLLSLTEFGSGVVTPRRFDKLVVSGDFTKLFDPNFLFFYKNSTNDELEFGFWRVVEATFDSDDYETTVKINTIFTDSSSDGVISQEEKISAFLAIRDCDCIGTVGWDLLQWDDNPENTTWNLDYISDPVERAAAIAERGFIDHADLLASITYSGTPIDSSPIAAGTEGELWYAEDFDRMYQFHGDEWLVIWNNFSYIVEDTKGQAYWDYTPGCGFSSVISGSDQWITQNNWYHKSDVPNFSIARQAQIPILEFQWDLELNEWTFIEYGWKYRELKFDPFNDTESKPTMIELTPFDLWEEDSEAFVLDESYGDQTSYFTPGRNFMGTGVAQIFEVQESFYTSDAPGQPFKTRVISTSPITTTALVPGDLSTQTPSAHPLRPVETSLGDPWKGYGVHWVFIGQLDTVPIPHQPQNMFAAIPSSATPSVHLSGDYEFTYTYYTQEAIILVDDVSTIELTGSLPTGTFISLRRRALIGANDVRVYIDGIRQYGTYDEVSEVDLGLGTDTEHVAGIRFLSGFDVDSTEVVRIELGEATPVDFGRASVPVRMTEDDAQYLIDGDVNVSLVRYRKEEQVKTETNQYPLFDIYRVGGEPAYKALEIFKYKEDPTQEVNSFISRRVVTDEDSSDYFFQQTLVESDGTMYAYRDYSNQGDDIWVNPVTDTVMFWDGFSWTSRLVIGNYYLPAFVGPQEPDDPWISTIGSYWYNTLEEKLYTLTAVGPVVWEEKEGVLYVEDDPTLQTIWRKGLNDEKYIPEQRDWKKRSEAEYEEEKAQFIVDEVPRILFDDSSLTPVEAETQAEANWYTSQEHHLSTQGEWIGEWEIPDPLYFNPSHENREEVTFRQLLTHFDTIVQAQPQLPGFTGLPENMFHLIPINEVNYGLGGKIHDYNYGFDTFLSSMFVHDVSPVALYEFAQDQYDALLNNLKELFRRQSLDLMLDTSTESLLDLTGFATDAVVSSHEQNDNLALLYGDSTTFTEVPGGDDIGIRNWIATLPYVCLTRRQQPVQLTDLDLNVNEVLHHDGHRAQYEFEAVVVEDLVQRLINTPDDRTRFPGPDDPPLDTFGRMSSNPPPNDVTEFESQFSTAITNREGVYWYHSTGTTKALYRLTLIDISVATPPVSYPDGTLWLDTEFGQEVLRIKRTNPNTGVSDWEVADGLIPGSVPIRLHNGTDPSDVETSLISAWQRVDLNLLLREIVFNVEQRLYDNAPEPYELCYDFQALQTQYPTLYNPLFEQAFYNYALEREIVTPLHNVEYDASDAFTWNYKYSIPGSGFDVIDSLSASNTFKLEGDVTLSFGLDVVFYVKNSGVNDGFWRTSNTVPSTFDGTHTTITVSATRTVQDTTLGVIYKGSLPSPQDPVSFPYNLNDGSESGGDWRDYYQKLYNTPYPNLEPWSLQGYTEKPDWWDEEYRNTDFGKWKPRHWTYKHGFEIVDVDDVANYFEVDGDFRGVFTRTPTTIGGEALSFGKDYLGALPVSLDYTIDLSPSNHDGTWDVDTTTTVGNVNTGTAGTASFEVPGNQTPTFLAGDRITVIDSTGTLTSLHTVTSSVFTGPPDNVTIVFVEEAIEVGTGYDTVSALRYFKDTNRTRIYPTAVIGSAVVEGRIAIAYGMWENIRRGLIPPNREYPNNIVSVTGDPNIDIANYLLPVDPLPVFSYFSVNVGNVPITVGANVGPDGVLPPYWDIVGHFGTPTPLPFDQVIRSVFLTLAEIKSPGANYSFGDAGPIEWEWRQSSQFLYDQLSIAFQLDPVRFMYSTFGVDFYTVGGLLINKRTEKVLSHLDTIFHGDIVGNQVILFPGTNQWYVNFGRYISLDISVSDFRSQWTQWTTPLSYQFSSFVDTPSVEASHRLVCLSEFDYDITAKRTPGVEDFWLNSLEVHTVYIPPRVARYDNDYDWEFEIRTASPSGRPIEYYDIRNYQFYADPDTSICSLFTWEVVYTDPANDIFSIPGDQTYVFAADRMFEVLDSTGNDGTYTTVSAVYDSIDNRTLITTEEAISSVVADGLLKADYRTMPWETGNGVALSTRETLPYPLESDNRTGIIEYFVIVIDDTHFQLALSADQATSGQYIDLTSKGRQDHFVGQLANTFHAVDGTTLWRHYIVDTDTVQTFSPPYDVRGIQTVINIVDGYESYAKAQGWSFNDEYELIDDSGRFVGWQSELERFIEWNFGLRASRRRVAQKYPTEVDLTSNIWTFLETPPQFVTGDAVSIYPSGGLYPTPLFQGGRYYIIRDSYTEYRLAATKQDAQTGTEIDITSLAGVDDLFVVKASSLRENLPQLEINPFRNAVWFRPEFGVVSNVVTGPTEDTFNTQLIIDQFGRKIPRDDLSVYREDKVTSIWMKDKVPNDIRLTKVFQDPYDYIHMSVLHIFLDQYEHVMLFHNETTEGQLLYDPFVGLNVTKIELLFNRQNQVTLRPNVGGQYLSTFFNQGADLRRNIEASVDDLRYLYDTYQAIEANLLTTNSRKVLGYTGEKDYFDYINLNAKSQFLFWRGMIQSKGSINAITAFVNSRRFTDAKVDEFWAYQVGDFGSAREKEYIHMWITPKDARSNDLRLQFLLDGDICYLGYASNNYSGCPYSFGDEAEQDLLLVDDTFQAVLLSDESRWYEKPDQVAKLTDNGGNMYFNMKPYYKMDIAIPTCSHVDDAPLYCEGSPLEFVEDLESSLLLQGKTDWIDTRAGSPSGSTYEFKRWNRDVPSTYALVGVELPNKVWIAGHVKSSLFATQLVEIVGSLYSTFDYDGAYRIASVGDEDSYVVGSPTGSPSGSPTGSPSGSPTGSPQVVEYTVVTLDHDLDVQGSPSIADAPGEITIWGAWETHGSWDVAGSPRELPLVRHNFACDYLSITLDWHAGEKVLVHVVGSPAPTQHIDLGVGNEFILYSNNIEVFKNGVKLANGEEYVEVYCDPSIGGSPDPECDSLYGFSTKLQFFEELELGTEIEVVYKTASLQEDVHYERFTSNIVRIFFPDLIGPGVRDFKIWGWLVDKDSQNPAKLIDTKAETVIAPIQFWDPARDFHYHLGRHSVDLMRPGDPAVYRISPNARPLPDPEQDFNMVYPLPWGAEHVGTTWINTEGLDYLPYYDDKAFPDVDERLRLWGSLAGWSDLKVYKWIESDISPYDYDAAAIQEEGNLNIPESERKSGRAVRSLFVEDVNENWIPVKDLVDEFDVSVDENIVVSVDEGTYTFPTTFPRRLVNIRSVDADTNTFLIEGDWTRRIKAGTVFGVTDENANWVFGPMEALAVYITEGTYTSIAVDDELYDLMTTEDSGQVWFWETVNLFINGQTSQTNAPLIVPNPSNTTQGQFTVTNLRTVDRVRLVYPIPNSQTFINAEVALGSMLQDYQFTFDVRHDEFGISRPRYYFWVEDNTIPNDATQMSPVDAQQSLITIPAPFVLFQKIKPAQTVEFSGVEYHLPHRFVQAVIRGLRGLVEEEFRYTIRWTRDFTLRDTLDAGETPLQKKNLHEEWILIRPEMPSTIPRGLWDRITESIIGTKRYDETVRVPSLERELYDAEWGTDTQYGLGDDQTFSDGDLALSTVLSILQDPNKDFAPVDINVYFDAHTFDTRENIIDAMDSLYNSFSHIHVNEIFFEVLLDAFSLKRKYEDIFKTSMIALHGIRPFDVGGVFDD